MPTLRHTLTAPAALALALAASAVPGTASADDPALTAKARTTVKISRADQQVVAGRVESGRAACVANRVVVFKRPEIDSTERGRTNDNGRYSFDVGLALPNEKVVVTAPATPRCKADSASRRVG